MWTNHMTTLIPTSSPKNFILLRCTFMVNDISETSDIELDTKIVETELCMPVCGKSAQFEPLLLPMSPNTPLRIPS
ncbi:hypothetical protein TNCV_4220971 [Trichonephila clavipes]|nr:hypothetical protein TNCV_4220971 [Trichonephila clavipes]